MFITFLYSKFVNDFPWKIHTALSPSVYASHNPETYLLSTSKPQGPRKEHIIMFLKPVTGHISNSKNFICGQKLGMISLLSSSYLTLALISTSCRTSLTLSPRIMLWFRTAFHIGENTSCNEQKKTIIFFLFLILLGLFVRLFVCGGFVVDILLFLNGRKKSDAYLTHLFVFCISISLWVKNQD